MDSAQYLQDAIRHNGRQSSSQLLPLVYTELRRLAEGHLANEKPGQTLNATALVHEAYLRLVDQQKKQNWDGRGHFFAAAAEAMRRILVENARRKQRAKYGGGRRRCGGRNLTPYGRLNGVSGSLGSHANQFCFWKGQTLCGCDYC